MARSIDSINVRRQTPPRIQPVSTAELRPHRSTAGAGGLAGAAILLLGAFFLSTRPSADSPPEPISQPSVATAANTAISTDQMSRPGPPQPELGESVEHAIILDRPLASSKTQDGSTGSTTATPSEATTTPKPDSFTTRILNGSGQSGAAATVQNQLTKLGFHITDTGTAVNAYQKSVIYYASGYELQAKTIQAAFSHTDTAVEQNQIASPADVLLVIGANAVES